MSINKEKEFRARNLAVQNDRATYEEFKANQMRQQARYAGAAAKNQASAMHYGTDAAKFNKFA